MADRLSSGRVGPQHARRPAHGVFGTYARTLCPLAAGLLLVGCDKLSGKSDTSPAPTSPSSGSLAAALPKPSVPPSEVVAKVNGTIISRSDVEQAIEDLRAAVEASGQTWKPLSTERRDNEYGLPNLVDDLVLAELRSQDAMASRILDRDVEVQRRFTSRIRSFFAQEWVGSKVKQLNVTSEEVEKFYHDNERGFLEPERIRVRHLIVSTEDAARQALAKLYGENADFVTVAQQFSIPGRADSAQNPQWIMRSQEKAAFAPEDNKVLDLKDPKLEQAAFSIDAERGVSNYAKGADGNYHLFQLVQRKPPRQQPLTEVSDKIKGFLQLQKLTSSTQELKEKAKIEVLSDRLAGIKQ